ncbi:twin-arginine translocation pathway signal protein [Rhodovarius crocodyli]|uniref:Twin-arginine translocation pathway signal protein n=1 Tax=Rhodovarius crocodyli TaxID=1979269 RepID=A0A437MLQ9_9PROT|nr:tripartite tricarboxylate transporter substrate-binding protein [Rhodovarius crocodyli]RVT98598.1 twin-arginine translocation pathway signal protein [Rhodovarius crocodyli]
MSLTLPRRGLAALALAMPGVARAQLLPRPARLIIGYAAGTAMDTVARLYAREWQGEYAAGVVVENRTGANGRLAVEAVKTAAPDGATILMTPESALTIFPAVYGANLRYDPLVDLLPVGATSGFAYSFAVGANHPARTFAEFVAWGRTQQDITYGSPAAGSGLHFLTVLMARRFGMNMTHVPYRETAQMLSDLEALRLGAAMQVGGNVTQLHQAGRLRVLAVSSEDRVPSLPDVPSFAELGYPEMTALALYGLALPAGTPQPMADKLAQLTLAAAAKPDLREVLARLDQAPVTSFPTPAAFAARIRQEQERWAPIVRESGFRAES